MRRPLAHRIRRVAAGAYVWLGFVSRRRFQSPTDRARIRSSATWFFQLVHLIPERGHDGRAQSGLTHRAHFRNNAKTNMTLAKGFEDNAARRAPDRNPITRTGHGRSPDPTGRLIPAERRTRLFAAFLLLLAPTYSCSRGIVPPYREYLLAALKGEHAVAVVDTADLELQWKLPTGVVLSSPSRKSPRKGFIASLKSVSHTSRGFCGWGGVCRSKVCAGVDLL